MGEVFVTEEGSCFGLEEGYNIIHIWILGHKYMKREKKRNSASTTETVIGLFGGTWFGSLSSYIRHLRIG